MLCLRIEPENKTFVEYLKKTLERLEKIKMESYEKMTRRVVFTDLDNLGFDKHATLLPCTELHLDAEQVKQNVQAKEEVVERQKEKKKKNKKKNKGLSDFMEKDESASDFKQYKNE